MPASRDNDRYLARPASLKLACSQCGSSGLIPLTQLSGTLFCASCRVWYRVQRNGLQAVTPSKDERILVAVRTSSSAWRQHQAVLRAPLAWRVRVWQRALKFLGEGRARWALAAALLIIVLFTAICGGMADSQATASSLSLPTGLSERAQLCTQALARRDVALVTSLTDPAMHRALRIWLAHAKELPPPVPHDTAVAATVESTTTDAKNADVTVVVVRLTTADGKTSEIRQQWASTAGCWYFRPQKLRSVLPPPPPRR